MHSSSVLLVQQHHQYHSTPPGSLRSPIDMSGSKLNLSNMRHYSLDSPSLTSPPSYDILVPGPSEQKHPCAGFSPGQLGSICSQNNVMGTPLPIASSSQFNPHLVMAPTAPPGLLHICKTLTIYAGVFIVTCTVFGVCRDESLQLLLCLTTKVVIEFTFAEPLCSSQLIIRACFSAKSSLVER